MLKCKGERLDATVVCVLRVRVYGARVGCVRVCERGERRRASRVTFVSSSRGQESEDRRWASTFGKGRHLPTSAQSFETAAKGQL